MKLLFILMLGFGLSLYSQDKEQPAQAIKVNESCATSCLSWYRLTRKHFEDYKDVWQYQPSQQKLWQWYQACLKKCIKSDKKKDKK